MWISTNKEKHAHARQSAVAQLCCSFVSRRTSDRGRFAMDSQKKGTALSELPVAPTQLRRGLCWYMAAE